MGVFGTIMNFENELNKVIELNKGYITRRDVDRIGIHSIYLSRFVKKHNLKQIVRGFYAEEYWIVDPYVIFQYTYPKYVFSFNSAIYLHGLGDVFPNYLEVTGPFNYRPMANNREDVITHTDTVDKNYNLGITTIRTSLGNVVRVYDIEKTICDIIRFKDKIEFEVYAKALNNYAKYKEKDIEKLMKYAGIMKIENKVRNQLEVLLNAN